MTASDEPRPTASGPAGAPGVEPYRLAPAPAPPRLPGVVVLRPTADEVIDNLAADLLIHAYNCVRAFGDFHLALSGEGPLEPLYMRLMYDPAHREFPWKRTHLWLVEERCVAEDDGRRAWPALRDIIVEHSDIPRAQAHPIDVGSEHAAREYERELTEALAWREKGHDRLDCVVLSAAGSSTWSAPAPAQGAPSPGLVERIGGANGAPVRVGLTERMVNAARLISVFAVGEEARPVVAAAAGSDGASPRLAALRPVGGALTWRLDHAACPG